MHIKDPIMVFPKLIDVDLKIDLLQASVFPTQYDVFLVGIWEIRDLCHC